MTLAGHPFDTAKVRLQTQSSTNPIYCELLLPPFAAKCVQIDRLIMLHPVISTVMLLGEEHCGMQLAHWML